jgi:hypothetical protein
MCPKTLEEKEKISRVPYASVISSLIYVMMCIHLDISYAIGLVNQYQSTLIRNTGYQSKGFYDI